MGEITWLIFGGHGWLGGQFCEYVKTQRPSDTIKIATCRADNQTAVEQELKRVQPSRVASFIGRTHGPGFSNIDYLEQKGKLVDNLKDNLEAPFVLAKLCADRNIHFSYLGTGCIFEFDDAHPQPKTTTSEAVVEEHTAFSEADTPNFTGSAYSTVKGVTDKLMHLFQDTTLNVRIRMPITSAVHGRNFITKISNYPQILSIPNSMTVVPTLLLPAMMQFSLEKRTGTINMVNPGLISHDEILTMYKEIVDPTHEWKSLSNEQQLLTLVASRRSNNQLATRKLKEWYPQAQEIHVAVRECLVKMKAEK